MTSRSWFFTIWDMDWDGHDYEGKNKLTYMEWQKEKCPETDKLHYQGWCKFSQPIRRTGMAKALGLEKGDYFAEPVKSEGASEKYCGKEETRVEGPWKIGKNKGQGFRSDLAVVADDLKKGCKLTEIVEKHTVPFIKFHAGIEKAHFYLSSDRDRMVAPNCYWLIGKPGSGKTRSIWDWADEKGYDVYMKDLTKWWNGYSQQEVIIIDDYRMGADIKLQDLLLITDRYPCQRETKGGYVKIKSNFIIITSNDSMEECFPAVVSDDLAALRRRCHVVTKWPVILG